MWSKAIAQLSSVCLFVHRKICGFLQFSSDFHETFVKLQLIPDVDLIYAIKVRNQNFKMEFLGPCSM